jgi:hypothetical protein
MSRTALLAGTAMLALTTGCALAGTLPVFAAKTATIRPPQAGGNILYSQNSNYGYSIISQNFTSGSMAAYNAVAADDFVVPRGKTWKVTGVDAAGEYFFGTGPASSEIITFYKNADSHPGTVVGRPQTVNCTDTAGSFACTVNRVKAGAEEDTVLASVGPTATTAPAANGGGSRRPRITILANGKTRAVDSARSAAAGTIRPPAGRNPALWTTLHST